MYWIRAITSKVMNSERKYFKADIVIRLGIPRERERLPDWISRCFVFGCDREAAVQRTKAKFCQPDVCGIALSESLVKERFFSLEKTTKFTELWFQTMSGVASRTRRFFFEQQKNLALPMC
jgi:hypothetical protein